MELGSNPPPPPPPLTHTHTKTSRTNPAHICQITHRPIHCIEIRSRGHTIRLIVRRPMSVSQIVKATIISTCLPLTALNPHEADFWNTPHPHPRSAAYMRQWTGSALVQVMAYEQTSVKFEYKTKFFICIWKCRPRDGGHFLKGEMSQYVVALCHLSL